MRYFIHIPKTAGTSLRHFLQNHVFRERLHFIYHDLGYWNAAQERERLTGEEVFYGHFCYGIHRLFLDSDPRYMTMLRHPVERVASLYRHVKRHADAGLPHEIIKADNLSLREYVLSGISHESNNHVTRILSADYGRAARWKYHAANRYAQWVDGAPEYQVHDVRHLQRALRHMEEHFDFIGFTESFAVSMNRLMELEGVQAVRVDAPFENVAPPGEREPINEETRFIIESANDLDLAMYRAVQVDPERYHAVGAPPLPFAEHEGPLWAASGMGTTRSRRRKRPHFLPLPRGIRDRVPKYQPHFDSLRGLAVLAVTSDHFTADLPNFPLPNFIHFGPVAVRFFLILSGYFITQSLHRTRTRMDDGRVQRKSELGKFYLRRMLRILPPYLLFLALGLLLNLGSMRTQVGWLATFTVDFLVAHLGQWPMATAHLWSVCVQEQFYLVWPLLILFLSRRWIFPAIVGAAAAGILFRVGCIIWSAPLLSRWVLPFGSLDALAAGAALAWVTMGTEPRLLAMPRVRRAAACLALIALSISCVLRNGDPHRFSMVFVEPLEIAALTWIVAQTSMGWNGWIGRVLSWRGLLFAGRISYGIYVYHVLVAICINQWMPVAGRWMLDLPAVRLVTLTVATLAVAAASWQWVERPLARLRRRLQPTDYPSGPLPA